MKRYIQFISVFIFISSYCVFAHEKDLAHYEMSAEPACDRGVVKESRPYAVSGYQSGIDWPQGQVLPHFASPADELDGFSIASRDMPGTEKMMFAGLQGLVNKTQPRIYLYDVEREGKNKWPDNLGLKINEYQDNDKWKLVSKYQNELSGVILYSTEKSQHYMNLAATIGGLKNALPVTKVEYKELSQRGISLPVIMDISGLSYETPIDIYNYLYDNFWKNCTKRLLVSLPPRIAVNIRDIGMATEAAILWLEPRNEEENAVLRRFLSDMKPGESVALGWWTEERAGIGICTEYGLSTIPSDFYENATVHSGLSHKIEMPVVPKKPELENKIYLAVFMSDGDNVQYCQHAMSNLWDDKGRGVIPINWTISPGLVDIGPGILNYYYKTATPNDFFASGPSGLGYALIYDAHNYKWNATKGSELDPYTKFTQQYLEKSGLRVITIWDQINEEQMESYAKNCRYLYGVTQQDWERQEGKIPSFVKQDKLAFIPNYPCYANGIDVIFDMNKDTIQRFDGKRPIFLSAQGESWKMGPDNIVALKEKLEQLSPGNIIICRGDHFFTLYNEANGLNFNLTLSGKMKISSSATSTHADLIADGTCAEKHRWVSSGSATPQITFDFKNEYKISRYVIREITTQQAATIRIETSTDGKSWTVVDERPCKSGSTTDMDIEKVNARYVKLTINNAGGPVSIGDVEIYGAVMSI